MIEDVQNLIDETSSKMLERSSQPKVPGRIALDNYHSLDVIYNWFEELAGSNHMVVVQY